MSMLKFNDLPKKEKKKIYLKNKLWLFFYYFAPLFIM